MIGSPFFVYLIERYGLKGTLLVWGGIQTHFAVCALLMRPTSLYIRGNALPAVRGHVNAAFVDIASTNAEISVILSRNTIHSKKIASVKETLAESKKTFWNNVRDLFRIKEFILLSVSTFFFFMAYVAPTMFLLPAHGSHLGLSTDQVALLATVSGLGLMLGRPIVGYVANKRFITTSHLLLVVCCVASALQFIIPSVGDNMVALSILSGLSSFTAGSLLTLPPIIISEQVPKEKYSLAIGWMGLFMGAPSLFNYTLFGKVLNMTYFFFK